MRKDEVKEEISINTTAKIVMQKEVKINLIKKDLKQEVIKRIKKTKPDEEKKRYTFNRLHISLHYQHVSAGTKLGIKE
jgi:hypothetical protein